jgi:hypothetical protein
MGDFRGDSDRDRESFGSHRRAGGNKYVYSAQML